MFCIQCGTQLVDGSKFCANCGTPVVVAPQNTGEAAPMPSPLPMTTDTPDQGHPTMAPPVPSFSPESTIVPPATSVQDVAGSIVSGVAKTGGKLAGFLKDRIK
jgi:hypothetical protein